MIFAAGRARSAATELRCLFLLVGAVVLAAFVVVYTVTGHAGSGALVAAAILALAPIAATAMLVERRLARPIDRLARELAVVARDNPHFPVTQSNNPWFARLSEAADTVQARL